MSIDPAPDAPIPPETAIREVSPPVAAGPVREVNRRKPTYFVGLAILTLAALLFLVGFIIILDGVFFESDLAPFGPTPTAYQETAEIYAEFSKERSQLAESIRSRRKQIARDRDRVNQSQDRQELIDLSRGWVQMMRWENGTLEQVRLQTLWVVDQDESNLQRTSEEENDKLVEKYRDILHKKARAAAEAQSERSRWWWGWGFSILGNIVLIAMTVIIGRVGVRMMKGAALPVTVFQR
jgi:hypothetical protein